MSWPFPFSLARIHRWTRMDGVRTVEGGEGVTGAMIRARIRVDGRLARGLQTLLGAGLRQIARVLKCSPATVRKALLQLRTWASNGHYLNQLASGHECTISRPSGLGIAPPVARECTIQRHTGSCHHGSYRPSEGALRRRPGPSGRCSGDAGAGPSPQRCGEGLGRHQEGD